MVLEGETAYLFNSSPKFADQTKLHFILKKYLPEFGITYKNTVFKKLEFWYRHQLQVEDTCSIWIAMVYYIIANDTQNVWINLKNYFPKAPVYKENK